MENFNIIQCYICDEKVEFQRIQYHFFRIHNFKFEKNNNFNQYICVQNSCFNTFGSFQNYRRHLINFHIKKKHITVRKPNN